MYKPKNVTSWAEVPVVFDLPYLCDLLKVTPDTASKMIKRGDISATKTGREWRITKTALLKFLREEVKTA